MTLAVVTGASRGIGRATALALAARGCRLALVGRPSKALDEVLERLREQGAEALAFSCDLSKPDSVEGVTAEILALAGIPDCVVHNAGVLVREPVQKLSAGHLDLQLAVNLRAPILLTRALLPSMLVRGRGRFLFVSSISGVLGTAQQAVYNATKWGLNGFMKSLAEELRDTGLMAVSILPGSVATEMLKGSEFPARMVPEDVAQTLVHYALDAPLAHNGSSIEIFGV